MLICFIQNEKTTPEINVLDTYLEEMGETLNINNHY